MMDQLMKNLRVPAIILAGAAVIYGVAKAYVYFQASSNMDRLVEQAAMFAEVRYDGISSDLLKGQVSINNISVTPVTLNDTIRIREAVLQGDGPLFLLTEAGKLGQQTPEKLYFALRGMELDLNGQMFSSYNSMAGSMQSVTGPVAACDFGGSLAASDMQEIGYDQLIADITFLVQNQPLSGKTRMEADIEVENMGTFAFAASVRGNPSPSSMMMSPGADQVSFSWSVNPDYMMAVTSYCAKKTGREASAYIDYLVNASAEDYVKYYGLVPGPAIRDAIRKFLVKPGQIELRMLPMPDMNPMMLQQYRPKDIIDILGLHLYVNGEEVKPLEFTFGGQLEGLFGDKTTGKPAGEEKKAEQVKPKASYVYQITPVERLSQYIGAQVKVMQTDGLEREGTLVAINKDEAQIEQRLHGGKFSVFVPVTKIRQVEVLRLLKE